MAKYVIPGPARSPLTRALGKKTESISVYSDRELAERQEAARRAGVELTVHRAEDE